MATLKHPNNAAKYGSQDSGLSDQMTLCDQVLVERTVLVHAAVTQDAVLEGQFTPHIYLSIFQVQNMLQRPLNAPV